jgi:LL-diaminopimelate aminotransferase
MKPLAQRMQRSSTQYFAQLGAKIARLQAEGKQIIRLDIGSPDLPPAPHIVAALAQGAAAPNRHGYQTHSGPAALRQAWADLYSRSHGVSLDPQSEIVPLLGSKEGIFHLSQAFLETGDVSLIPDPGYVTYAAGAVFAGAEPHFMPLRPQNGWLPDLEAIPADVLRRAKLLWLNYPNNPTAAIAPKEFLAQAVDFAHKHDLLLCHDAAYSQVGFEGYRPPSVIEIPGAKEVAIEFNSLSKSYNMAGWRVGAAVGNAAALKALYTLKTNLDSGHFLPIHEAAVAAMTGDQEWIWERNEIYRQRRDLIVESLRGAGLNPATPQASLYVWSPIPKGISSIEFTTRLLEESGVSLTPGSIFGANGEGYVRIAVSSPTEEIAEAMRRIQLALLSA